jgi:hypothetical protein
VNAEEEFARQEAIRARFERIYSSLLATQGKEKAIGALLAARLISIEKVFARILRTGDCPVEQVIVLRQVMRSMLMGVHAEFCREMKLSIAESIVLSASFKEVTRDLLL